VSIAFIEITEMIIYMSLNLYSCALVSLLFWVPIDIASFIKWNKNKDEKNEDLTKVKKLNWWQDILIILGIAAFSFIVGWLLSVRILLIWIVVWIIVIHFYFLLNNDFLILQNY
jgi:hypothetical protein